jgi:hypothetical protein
MKGGGGGNLAAFSCMVRDDTSLPTIHILADNRRGFKIINLRDFDPAKHVPVDEVPAQEGVFQINARGPMPGVEAEIRQALRKRGRPPKDRGVNNGA